MYKRQTDDRFEVLADAQLTVLGASIDIDALIGIYDDGAVFSATASISARFEDPISGSPITIGGALRIEVNTTDTVRFGLAANQVIFAIDNAVVSLYGISASGSIALGAGTSNFITVAQSDPLTISIGGQVLSVFGTINFSNGDIDLTGNLNINLGDRDIVAVSGFATISIRHSFGVLDFDGAIGLSLTVLDTDVFTAQVDIALSISLDGGFTLAINDLGIQVSGILNITGDFAIGVTSSGDVSLNIAGRFSLFGIFNADVSAGFDTATGTWHIRGTASVSIYISAISTGISASIFVDLSNEGFSIGGTLDLTVLGVNIVDNLGLSASVTADSISLSVSHAGRTYTFGSGGISSGSIIAGTSVFLDVNRNGILDDNEVFTIADELGNFSFVETDAPPARQTLLDPYDINGNGLLELSEGQIVVSGGTALANMVVNREFDNSELFGATGLANATVWFDANNNGVQDSGEVSVTTDEFGVYDFTNNAFVNLGRLAPFDTNNNGQIDLEEGVLVYIDGQDQTSGLDNSLVVQGSASTLGFGLQTTVSPLTSLQVELVDLGLTERQANDLLVEGLGLNPGQDISLFVLDNEALDDSLTDSRFQAESAQVSVLLNTGSALLLEDGGISQQQAASAIEQAIAQRFLDMSQTVSDGELLDLGFDDIDTVASILNSAADELGVQVEDSLRDSVGNVVVGINNEIENLADSGSQDLIVALAPYKACLLYTSPSPRD